MYPKGYSPPQYYFDTSIHRFRILYVKHNTPIIAKKHLVWLTINFSVFFV